MKRFISHEELARDSRFKRIRPRNRLLRSLPDDVLAQAVDYVLADELTHVRFGSNWAREFTRDDPERAARARQFQRETEEAFSFGGRQIAREERLEAGFTDEELDEIEALVSGPQAGPRRESLVAAAEMLRDRHRARKRGEPVPPLQLAVP